MAYQTPKTNWVSSDYINYSDYNRIVNNLWAVRSLYIYNKLYNVPAFESMSSVTAYSEIPTASKWNVLETNLDILNSNTCNLDIGTKKVFRANDAYINNVELNRLELGIKNINDKYAQIFADTNYTAEIYAGDSIGTL